MKFIAPFYKNNQLIFSAQEVRNSFLFGIKMNSTIANQVDLNFSDSDIEFHIRAAQKEIENYLNVKLFKQIYRENLSFQNDDWRSWGFIKTTYTVSSALRLEGFLNTTKQTTFPPEWLSIKKESSGEFSHRSIYIVPAGNTGAVTNSVIYTGLMPNLGYLNAGTIPNYWYVDYVTGFDKIPYDIMMAVGQLATISLLYIAGANILGTPGLSGNSLSIDGLSQSLTSALNAFGDRIRGYSEELQKKLPMLQGTYRGFIWGAM